MPTRLFPLMLLLLAPLIGCARSGTTPVTASLPAPAQFPSGEVLRPSDILLGRSYGMVGALFARFGSTPGTYSHAALVFEDAGGISRVLNFRPFGMEVCDADEYVSRYNHLALVRCKQTVNADAISQSARRWVQRNEENPVEPDYRMNRTNHDKLFCLELVSVIYKKCGLPEPFEKIYRVADHPVAPLVMQDFNMDISEVPSPNSVLSSPNFEVLATHVQPDYDKRKAVLNETILESLEDYYARGFTVQSPRLGGRIKIRMLLTMFHLKRLFTPHRRHATIPAYVGQRAIHTGYMFYQHVSLTKKRVFKQFDELDPDCPPDVVRTIAREASDHYRDHFFMPREESTETFPADTITTRSEASSFTESSNAAADHGETGPVATKMKPMPQ